MNTNYLMNSIPFDTSMRSPSVGSPSNEEDPQKLKQACQDFESLFICYLLKEMRATVPKSGLIGGGKVEEIYTSIMDQKVAEDISENRSIGISTVLLKSIGKYAVNSEPNNEKK